MRCVSIILATHLALRVECSRPSFDFLVPDVPSNFKIIAFSDVHGTQQHKPENEDLIKADFQITPIADDVEGQQQNAPPPEHKNNSDLEQFLQSNAWTYIKEKVKEPEVWGIVYGGDFTTGFNPFERTPNNKIFANDICQRSGDQDIRRLVTELVKVADGKHLVLLAGNHDNCLDPGVIKARQALDWEKALARSEALIKWIEKFANQNVHLFNSMERSVELGNGAHLCVSSSSPARHAGGKRRNAEEFWGNDLNGAFQYDQEDNTPTKLPDGRQNILRPCPSWKDQKCAVIAYHGAPGTAFTKNAALKFHDYTQRCQKELAQAITNSTKELKYPPVVIGGHNHAKSFKATPESPNEAVPSSDGISNYQEWDRDGPNVAFGNTAVKWSDPKDKENTTEYVKVNDAGQLRGWRNPLIIQCSKEGCKPCRDAPGNMGC